MITPEYCQMMAEYNQWMNQKIYAICKGLPEAEYKADRGAFFGSIHRTLDHILLADRIWMGRFTQQLFTGSIGQEFYADFEPLQQARQEFDRDLISWTISRTPQWLAQALTYTSGIDKKERTMPLGVLVTHLFNHQTHHRGQVTTLLSQLGCDIGSTDLPWLPKFFLD